MKAYVYAFCCLLGMNSVQAETDCPELIQPETAFAVNTTTRTYSDLAPQDRHELDVYWAEEATRFVEAVQKLTPIPSISLQEIQRSDYSDTTWELAVEMADSQVVLADYPGHYAEVAAINTSEPDSYATHLVVDFVASH